MHTLEMNPPAGNARTDQVEPGITSKTDKRRAPKTAFRPGQSGNLSGRPKRTAAEFQLIEACAQKTPAALAIIEELMIGAKQESVRMAAAAYVIERAHGKSVQRTEVVVSEVQRLTDVELDMLIALKANEAGMAPATLLIEQSEP
jgi:hypothetical protein